MQWFFGLRVLKSSKWALGVGLARPLLAQRGEGRDVVSLFRACIVGLMALATLILIVAAVAIEALSACEKDEEYDPVRAIWEEREALRILRARYAAGRVSREEYEELARELQRSRAR